MRAFCGAAHAAGLAVALIVRVACVACVAQPLEDGPAACDPLYGFVDCSQGRATRTAGASAQEMVHVVYSSDAASFPGLLSSMLSLGRSLQQPRLCTIHVIVAREDMEEAADLALCFRQELRDMTAVPAVTLHAMRPLPFHAEVFADMYDLAFARREMATPHIFVRQYIHEYLPEVRRAIWLDHDTIVSADLRPLYEMRMEHPVAAALEAEGHPGNFQEHYGMSPELYRNLTPATYFNTGVLLLDLERWRSGALTRAVYGWLEVGAWDQLSLNLAFQGGRFDRLEWWWNVQCMGRMALAPCCARAARVLHWTCGEKPWLTRRSPESRVNDHLYEPHRPRVACRAVRGAAGQETHE